MSSENTRTKLIIAAANMKIIKGSKSRHQSTLMSSNDSGSKQIFHLEASAHYVGKLHGHVI